MASGADDGATAPSQGHSNGVFPETHDNHSEEHDATHQDSEENGDWTVSTRRDVSTLTECTVGVIDHDANEEKRLAHQPMQEARHPNKRQSISKGELEVEGSALLSSRFRDA